MSDKTPSKSEAHVPTAAHDAPTTQVPRIPAHDKEPSAPATKSMPAVGKTISGVRSGDKDGAGNERNDAKQSFAERVSASVPASLRSSKPAAPSMSSPGESPGPGKADGATPSRPVTAGEYARTNSSSSSTTAAYPAVKDEAPRSTGAAAAATAASGRQASLKLIRVDPWSVTKISFALTVALMIVAVVAVSILWIVLSFAGVWDQINSSVATVLSDDSNSFDITDYLGFGRLVGLTLVISSINVVITTAVATIGAYLYNLAAQLLGGVDITLAEDD